MKVFFTVVFFLYVVYKNSLLWLRVDGDALIVWC